MNIIITGINIISENDINIYPNPIKELLNINLGEILANKITLFDCQGKLIYSSVNKKNLVTINLNKVSNGIYFLQIVSKKEVNTYKILKQ